MASRHTAPVSIPFAALAALILTTSAAARVSSSSSVVLHGKEHGTATWKIVNPDVGRSNAFKATGTVSPLGSGTSFKGTEHFPGFIARGYVQGRGKLAGPRGTITLTFKFGPYQGFTSTVTTPGTYHIISGTGQFNGATGSGILIEKIGAAGPPGTNKVTFRFNAPPTVPAR